MTSSVSSVETVLALNAAEDRLQAVLGSAGEIFSSREVRAPSRGITVLPRAVQQCLEEAGMQAADLDGIACVRGPGAFTGLRIAISYVLGLSQSAGVPTCGVDYLPLVAEFPAQTVPGELWAMIRARINTVYLQGFFFHPEHGLRAVSRPGAFFLDQACQVLEGRPASLYLVGSGLQQNREYLAGCLSRARFLDRIWDKPSADTLLSAASRGDYSFEPIEPSYMRPSDAEADLPRIAARRGVDLDNWRNRGEE